MNLATRRKQLRDKKATQRAARRRRRFATPDSPPPLPPRVYDENADAADCYTCAECCRRCSGAPFSVIQRGGFFAVGDEEESPPAYLCSRVCRDKFLPDFFPSA